MATDYNNGPLHPTGRVTRIETVTFAQGGSVSSAVQMTGYAGGAALFATGFEGVVHFQISADGNTYVPYDDEYNAPIVMTLSASGTLSSAKAAAIPDRVFGAPFFKLATYTDTTRATPKNQTSAGTVTLAFKS